MSKARELSKLPNYILSTVTELKLSVGKEQGDKAFIGGYYADGDCGGGDFYWDATSVETDNGGTILQVTGTTTGRWKRIYSGSVNVKWFGAKCDNTTNDVVAIQNAVNTAISNNGRNVIIDSDAYCASEIANKGSIVFIGNGSIRGLYRKNVFNTTDNSSPMFDTVNPTYHLKRFLSKTNPIIVVVGDSIATTTADANGKTESLYSLIQKKFTTQFPDKTITFHNRAIGGESYFTAVGLPSSFPSWYTNHATAWPIYVGALLPDLVIFNFGMNDSYSFQSSTILSYETLLDNAGIFTSGRPDIIHCTNLTPALDSTLSDFGTEAGQEGRDFVAGYIRSWCNYKGYGYFDFNRKCAIAKDGYDMCNTSLKKIGSLAPVNGAIVATEKCIDFKLDMQVSTLTSSTPIAIKLGREEVTDTDLRGAWLYVGDSSGNIALNLYDRATHIYADITPSPSFATPVGSFNLVVEKSGFTISVSINGTELVSYNKLITHGGVFLPRAGDATYYLGNITSAIFYAGIHRKYMPQILNDELWGESTVSTAIKEPFGGNGANHPSSLGVSAIFETTLDMAMNGFFLSKVLDVTTVKTSAGIYTSSGALSVLTDTPTVIATMSDVVGATYLVSVWMDTSAPGTYSATYIVNTQHLVSKATLLHKGTGIEITTSGLNILVKQISSITFTVQWSLLRIS